MMGRLRFQSVTFVKSAQWPEEYPVLRSDSGVVLPEIAVAGRSNVGKSSLLNHLFRRKGLVKTSRTPGKTQLLNFFTVDDEVVFADLPGYGYAKVPDAVRKHWGPMVQRYLERRTEMKLLLFLVDIRRVPNDEDRRMLEWAVHREKAVILVLTKCDKVTNNVRGSATRKILQAFPCENLHYVHYSVTRNSGRGQLVAMIQDAVVDETKDSEGEGADHGVT